MDASSLSSKVRDHLETTAAALQNIHRDVAAISDQQRTRAHACRAAKAKPPDFSVGDFVLTAAVIPLPNKLAIKWQGPKRVVRAVTDWIFDVQDLNPPYAESTHHVSRLRFYAESSREVTEDLLQYDLHSQGGHCIEAFCGIRLNMTTRQWEVEVKLKQGGQPLCF